MEIGTFDNFPLLSFDEPFTQKSPYFGDSLSLYSKNSMKVM